jgi:hypothetical protein
VATLSFEPRYAKSQAQCAPLWRSRWQLGSVHQHDDNSLSLFCLRSKKYSSVHKLKLDSCCRFISLSLVTSSKLTIQRYRTRTIFCTFARHICSDLNNPHVCELVVQTAVIAARVGCVNGCYRCAKAGTKMGWDHEGSVNPRNPRKRGRMLMARVALLFHRTLGLLECRIHQWLNCPLAGGNQQPSIPLASG